MLNAEDRQKLNDLARRVAGQDHYDAHPEYGKIPKGADLDNREWDTAANIIDNLKLTTYMVPSIKMVDKISGDLSAGEYIEEQISANTNFDAFSFVSQGSGTIVLLGQSEEEGPSILRIAPHIDSKLLKLFPLRTAESMRSGFQGMLQTTQDNVEVGTVLQVETLPFGKVIDLSRDEQATYRRFLNNICEDTCYNPDDLKEVMVLPDATLTLFDAGECSYKQEFLYLPLANQLEEEHRSQTLIQTRLESWGLPKEMVWTQPNGDLKQRAMFPSSDYNFVLGFKSADTPTIHAP